MSQIQMVQSIVNYGLSDVQGHCLHQAWLTFFIDFLDFPEDLRIALYYSCRHLLIVYQESHGNLENAKIAVLKLKFFQFEIIWFCLNHIHKTHIFRIISSKTYKLLWYFMSRLIQIQTLYHYAYYCSISSKDLFHFRKNRAEQNGKRDSYPFTKLKPVSKVMFFNFVTFSYILKKHIYFAKCVRGKMSWKLLGVTFSKFLYLPSTSPSHVCVMNAPRQRSYIL